MNVLILENNREIREVIVFALELEFGARVHEASDAEEAEKILREIRNLDVVISDAWINRESVIPVLEKVRKASPGACLIVYTDLKVDKDPRFSALKTFITIDKPVILRGIVDNVRKWMETEERRKLEIKGDFCRLRIGLILNTGSLDCDLYIQINETKYVRISRKEEPFVKEDFERYASLGVEYLYLKKKDAEMVLGRLTADLSRFASQSDLVATDWIRAERILASTQEAIVEVSAKLGFDQKVYQAVEASVKLALEVIKPLPTVMNLVKDFHAHQANYAWSHSVILGLVSCGIASRIESLEAKNSQFRLTLAALLHDLALRKPALARLDRSDVFPSEMVKLDPADVEDIKTHSGRMAELAKTIPNVPPETVTIILEHHERPDGRGYPSEKKGSEVGILSAIMIVAHDLVDFIFENSQRSWTLEEFLRLAKNYYEVGNYKKVIEALQRQA